MAPHVCPWWGGYVIDNRLRRIVHPPEKILAPYVRTGMTALDFGCGMGLFALAMARSVGDEGCVIAADLQQKMLDVLQRRAQKAGMQDRIRTHRCEADTLGIEDTIDFALAFYAAHEAPDQQRLLREIHTRLRPDGRLLVVEPVGHVTKAAFRNMTSWAQEVGFVEQERPRVFMSRAVVFAKEW
jgi:ubiquinone/menaquinone biosynthesis C-methylase UbiE